MSGSGKLEWDPSLNTGIDEIDRQHRYFIRIVNELVEEIARNSRDTAVKALRFMDRYAHWHFETEESYMKIYGYPEYQHHIGEHRRFYENTRRLTEKAGSGDMDSGFAYEVNRFLIDWLILHIKNSDRKFSEFLREKGIYTLPEEDLPDDLKEIQDR